LDRRDRHHAFTGLVRQFQDRVYAYVLGRLGASVNARSAQGWTPLRYAIALGRDEMAAFLREHGGEE